MATIREVLYQHTKKNSSRSIARAFNMSNTTVKKYIKIAKSHGYKNNINDDELQNLALKVEEVLYKKRNNSKSTAMNLLFPYKEKIGNWLKEPNITQTQIHRLLSEDNVIVSRRSISRFIQTHFAQLTKSTVHLPTEAGKEAQVDFGYVGMMHGMNGKLRKTYVFVMTLSHSRYRYVEFTFSQDQVTWAQLHMNAFKFFGGSPARIVLDNLKAGVIKYDIYDPTLNETYSELSRFYGFTIDPAKAYKPEHKGKVERSIRIVKEQLIAGRTYLNIGKANAEAISWCKNDISDRVCSSTGAKPIDTFLQEEKPCLIALPTGEFDIPVWTRCKVHKDHHFVAKGNFYSVPTQYIGKDINVRIGLKTVSAYFKNKIIKTHLRNYEKGKWITDAKDYPKSALYYLENTSSKCLSSAKTIGDATYKIISETLDRFSRTGLRKAQAILRLGEKYSNNRLEAACLRAVTYDNYAYKAISNILENKLDQQSTESFGVHRVQNIMDSAYIRDPKEYSSDMEANYA